jgi:hypothetical protein
MVAVPLRRGVASMENGMSWEQVEAAVPESVNIV